ncbi:MAG: CBS domain-containing protein [Magnetococcales bacterium]|nr:CBS domain-containing protein [Magnetococcales bacterium]MBF0148564.1 CBS domain-containing protein [Magnetococcales bacterium]MBF0173789.1 CBS domain-containing protein [Magnetococcales bacterium]MBF0348860.1 CBS domain-containing protein [Magnetococcales bacterium]
MNSLDDLESLIEKDRSVAYVREDGLNSGDVHLIFDVATSIALTGLMMMMGEAVIQTQVKTRDYNEEFQEGFNEVSNQVVGAMNDLVEKKMPEGGHLFLEKTTHCEFGNMPPTFRDGVTYLVASADIQVANFPVEVCRWVMSRGFAEALLKIEIEGTPEEMAASAAKAPPPREAPPAPEVVEEQVEVEEVASSEVEEGEEAPGMATPEDLARIDAGSVEFSNADGLPAPDEPGSVRIVMLEQPFSLKEEEKIMRAINAMREEGHRYIGVDRNGKLIRVVSQSDLRQVMGPFFGTKAMGPRDKAICTLPLGKLNQNQQLVRVSLAGTINQAADLLMEFNLRALPVISNQGVLRGFVTVHAVLNYFRKKKRA